MNNGFFSNDFWGKLFANGGHGWSLVMTFIMMYTLMDFKHEMKEEISKIHDILEVHTKQLARIEETLLDVKYHFLDSDRRLDNHEKRLSNIETRLPPTKNP